MARAQGANGSVQLDRHDPKNGSYVIDHLRQSRSLLAATQVIRHEASDMETPIGGKPGADLRDYLAEERTFLAWIRTGLALMGFGFVLARFGLFLAEIQAARGESAGPPHRFSLWFGTAFIAVGVAMNLLSVRRHLRLVVELNRGQVAVHRPSHEAVILALFLALVGVAMALYLTLA
jgi:putative membrane protein